MFTSHSKDKFWIEEWLRDYWNKDIVNVKTMKGWIIFWYSPTFIDLKKEYIKKYEKGFKIKLKKLWRKK